MIPVVLFLSCLVSTPFKGHQNGLSTRLALPSRPQAAWQEMGFGVFVHFAPNTFTDQEGDDLSLPLDQFNPTRLNTDQWAAAASSIGARYVVLVAKHVGGFCLWPTATTDYSVKSTPWRGGQGDIVKDMAASCRKYGLKLGVYLSPMDRKHGVAVGGRAPTPVAQVAYDKLYRAQLTELLTHYGPIVEIWFDGSQVVEVGDLLKKYAPKAMIFQGKYATIRWVGNEDGFAPYPAWNSVGASDAASGTATAMHGDPQGTVWLPNEVDVSLRRPYWFWSRTNSDHVMSVSDLLSVYYKSIGRGANLLVNFSPSRDGLIDGPDVARAKEFGDLIRTRFGHPLKQVAGSVIRFSAATQVDHVLIQEDILKGERVRQFQVLGLSDDGKSEVIGSGTAIGVRRLIPVGHRLVRELRLQVDSSIGTPQIKNFAAFATGAEPPSDWNSPAGIYADDAVGNWDQAGSFAIDLANKMGSSTNYRVRFVGQGGVSVRLLHPELVIDGVAQPALLRPEAGRADAFIVTLTALAKSIVLKGELAGAAKGTVLVKRQ